MEKVFVKVRCSHLPDGTIRPESLEWEDGQAWEITRTIHVAAPADHEFEGIRYTVLIGSAEKYIYRIGTKCVLSIRIPQKGVRIPIRTFLLWFSGLVE